MIDLFILIFLILLFYYSYFLVSILMGLTKLKPVLKKEPVKEFVIAFRNEEDNILENLKSIEAQNYPKDKFEVIYVNDSSTDKSVEILQSSVKNANIKVLVLPEDYEEIGRKKISKLDSS